MNCRHFQHRLYEYLDGSLSPGAQAAAEKHLSGCADCRETLRAERQVAQSLSERFRQTTDSLQLPPEVQHRVLAALAHQRRAPAEEHGWGNLPGPRAVPARSGSDGSRRSWFSECLPMFLSAASRDGSRSNSEIDAAQAEERGSVYQWGRWAWPVGLAASVLLLLAGVFLHVRAPRPQRDLAQPHPAGSWIQVQFSYVVPTYTFRQEGGLVVDALTYQTNTVNERLPAR